MEWRVERLADEVGVSVDTVRYYQAKGLLHPPRRQGRLAFYDESHRERLERIRALQARGFTLATIARVLAGELDAADEALVGALVAQSAGGGDHLLGLEELAEVTGIPAPVLRALERDQLLVASRVGGTTGYTSEDVAAARAGLVLLEHGLPLSDLLDLARDHHEAMVAVARRAVSLFDTHVRHSARPDEVDAAGILVEAFEALLPATTTLVAHHFTRVLLQCALEQVEHVGTVTGPGGPSASPRRAAPPRSGPRPADVAS